MQAENADSAELTRYAMQALGAREAWHAHGNEHLRASASHARGPASSRVVGFLQTRFFRLRLSHTRTLESLTAVVHRLDRGSASCRPQLRLVQTAVAPRLDRGCASFRPR